MKIGIVGLGLMGGSLGRALKKYTSATVYAYDIDQETVKKGKQLGCFDEMLSGDNIGEVDMLAVSVYPSAFNAVAQTFFGGLKSGAIVFDLAGNKQIIAEKMLDHAEIFPNINFIATHPMAGREFSGVEHSVASLFEGCYWVTCPVRADKNAISALKRMLLSLGARKIVTADAANHDRVIAYTSQLCHVVSSAYIRSSTADEGLGFTAGSFRDLTRVARLNPEMWTELFLDNKENLSAEIEVLINNLRLYLDAIMDEDREGLKKLLKESSDKKILNEKTSQRYIKNDKKD